MDTAQLTPDQLDAQALRLHDTDAWQRIVTGWEVTAPEHTCPVPERACPAPGSAYVVPGAETTCAVSEAQAASTVSEAAWAVSGAEAGCTPPEAERLAPEPLRPPPPPHDEPQPTLPADWRNLLSVPVSKLVEESLRTAPALPTGERRLPGRLGALLPDHLHAWRRIGQPDVRPSTHLGHARQILTEWGWQNTPYRLRNARGARCLCGAMLTAHRLGFGSLRTVDRAGAWMITELRSQGWHDLIGPWNRHPGRTAEEALALIDATIRRASQAGE